MVFLARRENLLAVSEYQMKREPTFAASRWTGCRVVWDRCTGRADRSHCWEKRRFDEAHDQAVGCPGTIAGRFAQQLEVNARLRHMYAVPGRPTRVSTHRYQGYVVVPLPNIRVPASNLRLDWSRTSSQLLDSGSSTRQTDDHGCLPIEHHLGCCLRPSGERSTRC